MAKAARIFVKLEPESKKLLDNNAVKHGQTTAKRAADIINWGLKRGIK